MKTKSWAEQVRSLRSRLNMSRLDFANELTRISPSGKVSPGTVYGWENGITRTPSMTNENKVKNMDKIHANEKDR